MNIRLFILISFCLLWSIGRTQPIHSRIGIQKIYLPHFKVQEASDENVQAIGIRWMLSAYELTPFEFGFHVAAGYGEVARASFGFNLAYRFTHWNNHDVKVGLSLSEIDLENVEIKQDEFGPHVGDVSFTSMGTEFKPYIEWEWTFFRYGTIFAQAGYRIINGEKSVVTSVEQADEPNIEYRVRRNESFFYSGAGFEFSVGLSIQLFLN